MTTDTEFGYFLGESKNKVGFVYHISDTRKQMLRNIRERKIYTGNLRGYVVYGMCAHPTVYCDYEKGAVNIIVDIFLNLEDVCTRTILHETYHALKMLNFSIDILGNKENRYNNEENIADVTGKIIADIVGESFYKEAQNG
jgi:hypothetical protein